MKSPSVNRRKAAQAALDDFGFTYGFFFHVMPVPAIVIGFVGVVTGIVTPQEALVSVAVTSLWVSLAVYGSLGVPVARVVGGAFDPVIAMRFFAALTPFPVVGRIAEFAGMTMVLWLPAVILAVVKLASRM